MGCNDNCEMEQVRMFVTSLPGGFRVEGPTQAVEGEKVELVCGASKSVVDANIFHPSLNIFLTPGTTTRETAWSGTSRWAASTSS